MEAMVFSGVVIMLLVGVAANIWSVVVRLFTGAFAFALCVIVIGFLFGGTEAFTSASVSEWTSIFDVLLGDGVGERVVDAFMVFVTSTWESFKA